MNYSRLKNELTAGDPPLEEPLTPFAVFPLPFKKKRESSLETSKSHNSAFKEHDDMKSRVKFFFHVSSVG